jgi:hypothetical protein
MKKKVINGIIKVIIDNQNTTIQRAIIKKTIKA